MDSILMTNGVVFKKHEFLVGVSVDGTEALHNLHRHDKNGADTYQKVKIVLQCSRSTKSNIIF